MVNVSTRCRIFSAAFVVHREGFSLRSAVGPGVKTKDKEDHNRQFISSYEYVKLHRL